MQFYSLITKTWTCWENLFKIRKRLIKLIFRVKNIFYSIYYRKKYIDEIHEYQILHKGKLRRLPCILAIKNAIKSIPHPDKYDYDCFNNEIVFSTIIFFCIKRYKPNYNLHSESFSTRLLRIYCPYEEFNTVDQFFLCFRSKNYGIMNNRDSSRSSMKISCSILNLVDINNNRVENSPKVPILKTHGRYSQAGQDTGLPLTESHFEFSIQGGNANSGDSNLLNKCRLRSKTQSNLGVHLASPEKATKLSDDYKKSFTSLYDATPLNQPFEA